MLHFLFFSFHRKLSHVVGSAATLIERAFQVSSYRNNIFKWYKGKTAEIKI